MYKRQTWARSKIRITKADEDMVFMARRSFLFINGQPWVKRDNPTFDVTMGAFDGAEVAEFVGMFALHKLSFIMNIADFALYRDDGICAIKGSERTADHIRQKIEDICRKQKFLWS